MSKLNLLDVVKANTPQVGEPKTPKQVCKDLGLNDPTKLTLNLVAKILREEGLSENKTNKGVCFYCLDWDAFFEKAKLSAKQ
jgi:hypothetical protein